MVLVGKTPVSRHQWHPTTKRNVYSREAEVPEVWKIRETAAEFRSVAFTAHGPTNVR